jgi:hypothetical protein
MSLEIEAQFNAGPDPLLCIAWFEGSQEARLVVTGPQGEREEVQIKHIEASLSEEVTEVLRESIVPESPGAALTARLQVSTQRERVGRAVRLAGGHTKADQLCGKLLKMAELMAQQPGIVRAMGTVRQQLPG